METITIRLKDSKALKLIHDLEELNLIQIVENLPSQSNLSEVMSGSISKEQAKAMHAELLNIRSEWQKDTY